ncbi:MAG TPA: hypothetical protein EYQ15_04865 [Candidatus Poseidoniales archaeon]|nr:MAG: hypothetical protein CXT65_01490 [Euryarchaeota archaeon]HIG38616.1 hypothetical protein [Candidatus Poseidoniales archaeon]HIL43485.1 hypothetical protein [Candidatus Poseidoniales archaeon]
MEDGPRKLTAAAINLCLLLPVVAVFVTVIATPIASAEATCDVPAENSPEIDQYFEEHSIEDLGFWSEKAMLKPLNRDFSTDMTVYNDSANAIRMELVPGYQYTFCLYLSSDSQSAPTMGAIGDVYLMNEANWDRYTSSYESREWDDLEEIVNELPVEWRDLAMWLPFRDVHAYESVSSQVFSVAIDSIGSAWSSVSWFDSGDPQYYLVVDGWDNGRSSDRKAAGGSMNVEILVDVEERTTLPNFVAYILIAALPIACIIGPLIIHSKYMSAGLGDEEDSRQVPYLESERDERGQDG